MYRSSSKKSEGIEFQILLNFTVEPSTIIVIFAPEFEFAWRPEKTKVEYRYPICTSVFEATLCVNGAFQVLE